MPGRNISRRGFLKGAAAAGTAAAFPSIVPSNVLGAEAPSNQIVMGAIGVGSMGTGDLNGFLSKGEVRVVAVCDVDQEHRQSQVREQRLQGISRFSRIDRAGRPGCGSDCDAGPLACDTIDRGCEGGAGHSRTEAACPFHPGRTRNLRGGSSVRKGVADRQLAEVGGEFSSGVRTGAKRSGGQGHVCGGGASDGRFARPSAADSRAG